jgi:beta-1,4-mannosyltransferase
MSRKYSYKQFEGRYIKKKKKNSFFIWINRSNNSSRFTTEDEKNNIVYLQDRPAILVSSTSWSEDENFTLLFDALKSMFRLWFFLWNKKISFLEYASQEMKNLPSIVCIVTGKKYFNIERFDGKHSFVCLL